MYLKCGPRQLFFQSGPETPKGWTALGGRPHATHGKPMTHFELVFVKRGRAESNFMYLFLHLGVQLLQLHSKATLCPPSAFIRVGRLCLRGQPFPR